MNKILCVIIFLSIGLKSYSQKNNDISFVKFLCDKGYYKECILEVNLQKTNIEFFTDETISRLDSLNYYLAWSYYSIKQLRNSISAFKKVGRNSVFYNKSVQFAAYNHSHLGEYFLSNMILEKEKPTNIINFQKAGNNLLKRDINQFNYILKSIDTSKYYLQKEISNLKEISLVIKNHKEKSPILAAGMSSLIPGLGKIYAGKIGQGISSFLTCSMFALIGVEQYNKRGLSDYRTIIASSLFTIFYIGNIWGSYFSVLIAEKEYNNAINKNILFNIHIPLRNFYN